jgi:pimeloyl-ACP methyl ester carboxylesterase
MDGKLPLILLPGLDGVGVYFGRLLEHLPGYIEPTVISYPRDQVMGYEELLPLVIERLPQSPFILLGESFSSPLSIKIAAARPPGLRGVILCSGFARNPLWLAPTWLTYFTHPLLFRLYAPYIRFKVWRRGGGSAGAARLAALSGLTPHVIAKRVRSVLRVNVMQELSTCPVPVLYVRGARDHLIHARNLLEMSKRLPSMRVASFDAGHCVLKSRAGETAAAIVDFIESCNAPDADERACQEDPLPQQSCA